MAECVYFEVQTSMYAPQKFTRLGPRTVTQETA